MANKGLIDVAIKNYQQVKREAEKMTSQIEKAASRTVSDMKQRAPTVVRRAVQERYTVTASQVTSAAGKPKKVSSTAGSIKLRGVTIENLQIVYSGERVTPALYKMTPKARNGNRKQTIKVEIVKGQKKPLHTSSFLGKGAGTIDIPFVRTSAKRIPIRALYTVAVPQMVLHNEVSTNITGRVSELLQQRLEHNIEQLAKK